MDIKSRFNIQNLSYWNHKIRMVYWLIVASTCIYGFITYSLNTQEDQHTLLWRSSILLIIVFIGELLFRIRTKKQDYVIIMIGAGISTTLFSLIPSSDYGVIVFLHLPILLSTLYLNYWKVLFASLFTLTTYVLLMAKLPVFQNNIPMHQVTLVFSSIAICTFLIFGIVKRGLGIMKAEEDVLLEEKRLISQKLSMDVLVRKDALTGLDNHKTFQEQLGHIVEMGKQQGVIVHLAILDIDNFKKVNDSHGHWAGDIVLRRVGILIDEQCDENVIAARYGGEEFAVLFTNLDSQEVNDWLEALSTQLKRTKFAEIGNKSITFSTGCHRLQPDNSKEQLFQYADQALYRAKTAGKDQTVWS
jgi:diguanylate cyclase (GGDEF)-like protein